MITVLHQRFLKHYWQLRVKAKYHAKNSFERNKLYFGYGANLSMDRFHARKMNVREIGNAYLPDHEIRFSLVNEYKARGFAGVHFQESSRVYGVLYEMDEESLALLDILEWVGFGSYERRSVKVTLLDSSKDYESDCYFVLKPREGLYPSVEYLSGMIRASKERSFPQEYIKFLEGHEARESFEIDHGFSLRNYGERRVFAETLKPFYRVHDKLRKILCDLI